MSTKSELNLSDSENSKNPTDLESIGSSNSKATSSFGSTSPISIVATRRILGVSTIEIGDVVPNGEISFQFDEPINYRSVGLLLFSESDVFYSDFVDVKIPSPQVHTKLVIISDVTVEDTMGNKLSELEVGSIFNIKSKTLIQFAADQESNETAYTYYVQIKKTSEIPDEPSTVEFIGKFDGRFIGTGLETQNIDWIPEQTGLFYIETFVWDRNNVPIAEQGPLVLVIVN